MSILWIVIYILLFFILFSIPSVTGARVSGLEERMNIVEERLCDLDARGSEEADNLTNEQNLDRFILTGNIVYVNLFC